MLSVLRGVLTLLPPGLRRRWLLLVPFSVLAAVAEALSAAVVFTLITVLGDPASVREVDVGEDSIHETDRSVAPSG